MKPKIFISYSSQDKEYKDNLYSFLLPFVKDNKIEVWEDSQIEENYLNEIPNQIENSNIAILLISRHFFNNNFITEKEMPLFRKKNNANELHIIAVKVRPFNSQDLSHFVGQTEFLYKTPLGTLTSSQQETELEKITSKVVNYNFNSITPIVNSDNNVGIVPKLIGRDTDISEIDKLLLTKSILMFYGAPGQGKSSLAKFIAQENQNNFCDGCKIINLQNEKNLDNIKKHISLAIGNVDSGNIFNLLNQKKVLLILDSFEEVIKNYNNNPTELASFFDSLHKAINENSKIIITSQVVTNHPTIFTKKVSRLSKEDSFKLFKSLLNEDYITEQNVESIKDFVDEKLEGHPLSIKIVAEFTQEMGFEFGNVIKSWENTWSLIAKYNYSIDYKPLMTSFELSFNTLDENEKIFLLLMSSLPDGIDANYLATIWEDEFQNSTIAFSTLSRRSLIERENSQFRLLGPIFKYAETKVSELLISPNKNQLNRFTILQDKIDSFIDTYINENAPQEDDRDTREKNRKVVKYFYNIHNSLDRRLNPSEKKSALNSAESVLKLYWAYHNNLSGYKNAISSAEDAIHYIEKASNIFKINNRNEKVLLCNFYLGSIYWLRGNNNMALPYLESVLENENTTEKIRVDTLRALAHIEYDNCSISNSVVHYENVIELSKGKYTDIKVKCHTGLIDAYRKLEEFEKALAYYNSIKGEIQTLQPSIRANVLRGIAFVLYQNNSIDEAERLYKEAFDIFSTVSPFGQAHCKRGLAEVYLIKKDFQLSKLSLDESIQLYKDANKYPSLGSGLALLAYGKYYYKSSDKAIQIAINYLNEAKELFSNTHLNKPFEEGQALEQLGDIYLDIDKLDEALGHYSLSLVSYKKCEVYNSIKRLTEKIEKAKEKNGR